MMNTLRALFSRKAILPRLPQGESFRARLRCCERLETRAMLAADALSAWQNHVLPNDVNGDGYVTAIDALNVINELNIAGARQLAAQGPAPTINRARFMAAGGSARYLDVNGDGHLTSMDALAVVNKLNAAQGEQVQIRLSVTDLAGNPIEAIGPGQEFQLRGFVKDLREPQNDPVRGAYSFYADVLFDQTKSTVDLVGRSIAYGSLFPNGENTDSSITATAGKLENIGAFGENEPYGSQEVVLFIVPMQAAAGASGVASFMVQDDMSNLFDVAMHGSNESVPPGEILFMGDQVTIGFPPTAGDDTASVVEDSGVNSINVRANDTPHQSGQGPLLVVDVTQGAQGLVEIAPDGLTVRYTPAENYFGPDTFTYTVEDADGNSATATVSVNVTAANDPPTANNDNPVVDSDSTANEILVLGNDTFLPDAGETLMITAVGPTNNGGTATIATGNQRILYTPQAGFTGTETFTYTISDGTSTATATVTVTVNNDNPNADDDNLSGVGEDSVSNPLDVLANDELAPGVQGELTIISVGPRSDGGTVTISQDMKMLSYTPAPNFFGTESFTYTISDGQGGQATATVNVTVDNINDPPAANDDTFTRAEDSTNNNLPVLDNDSMLPDAGETLTITDVGPGSAGGTIEILPGNTVIRYTPLPNFVGTETFEYTISDGGEEDTATVTVMVTEVTETPQAGDNEYTVDEDSTNNSLTVLSNDTDPDPGDTLTISAVTGGTRNGTITISTDMRSINYTPAPNVFGEEIFTYTVSDGHGGSDTAEVRITIVAANDPPNAVDDDDLSVTEGTIDNTLNVLANDTNPDSGETLTITAFGETSGEGTVSLGPGGLSLIYTPAADFTGEETFTYTISDGNGMTDTATVTVTVNNVNNPPTANDDEVSVAEDSAAAPLTVLANDSFAPDTGETLTITAVTPGSMGGAVTISNDSLSVMYEPDENFFGEETFTYTISDGNGGSDTATVTVTVNAVNDPPVAVDDLANAARTTAEDTPLTINPATLLANDTDVEDNTLTITAVSGGVGGTVALAGGTITFTPTQNFNGAASFVYTVSDGNGGTDTGAVNLTVTAANDPPTAANDTFDVMRGSSNNTLNPLANDDDAPDTGETLTITAVGTTSNGGTVTITQNETRLSYTPAANFSGTETFTYTISDGNGGTATATVTVNVANFTPGSLSGFVYVDSDSDGAKDGAEQPIANVTIRLWGKDILGADVDIRTTTDASGAYRFDNVMPGGYVIEEIQPDSYLDGAESLGTQGGTAGHDMFFIALANGTSGANNNFGERGLRPAFIGRPNFFVP